LQLEEQIRNILPLSPNSDRVVVERLDSLDSAEEGKDGLSDSDFVCPVMSDEDGSLFYITSPLTTSITNNNTPSPQEKTKIEQPSAMDPKCFLNPPTPRVNAPKLKLDTKKASLNIFDDLEPLLDTPTAEKILDNFLSTAEEANLMIQGDDLEPQKWSNSFDDLFPDLD